MISRRLALAGLAAALLPAAVRAHPHEALDQERLADLERQISTFRTALKDTVQSRDVQALRAMYAEGFTHTHGSGRVDGRDTRIVSLLAGEPVIETAPVAELTIRFFGPDMAIVTGRSPILNTAERRSYDFRWLQAMTRSAGHWQLAASQATRLAPTA